MGRWYGGSRVQAVGGNGGDRDGTGEAGGAVAATPAAGSALGLIAYWGFVGWRLGGRLGRRPHGLLGVIGLAVGGQARP